MHRIRNTLGIDGVVVGLRARLPTPKAATIPMHLRNFIPLACVLTGTLSAQSNAVAGLDGKLYAIANPTVWGRRGAAHPNGELGFSVSNTMCNPGSITIPWFAVPQTNHPKFGFMVTRLQNDRMVQISDRSYCKHAFLSLNTNSGTCLPCTNPGTGSVMGIGCSDVYAAGNNGDRNYLGPPDEINPWLGTWNMVGSYFDRGDPMVASPANNDGSRSTITTAGDVVKNRVTIKETDIQAGSTYFYQIHLLHEGESVAVRGDNLMTRGVSFNWTGTAWQTANVGTAQNGSVLTQWPGASLGLGGNGNDDGRISIAVKVTGPTNGLWHYEYAVHNVDNHRGAATFRIPMCTSARVLNVGFRDIDQDSLNQWTSSRQGGELVFSAPGNNALNWNSLFNFWFDSDAAPIAGNASFDQARVGPGALSFTVPTQVAGFVPTVYLGSGCGSTAVTLRSNGLPTIPNAGFGLQMQSAPATGAALFLSPTAANTPLGGGCTSFLDATTMVDLGFLITDGAGLASLSLPIPAGLFPGDVTFQAASLAPGVGAFLGDFNLSNGITVRVGGTGCP